MRKIYDTAIDLLFDASQQGKGGKRWTFSLEGWNHVRLEGQITLGEHESYFSLPFSIDRKQKELIELHFDERPRGARIDLSICSEREMQRYADSRGRYLDRRELIFAAGALDNRRLRAQLGSSEQARWDEGRRAADPTYENPYFPS